MKKFGISLVAILMAAFTIACQSCKAQDSKSQDKGAYSAFLSQFNDSTAYAVVILDGQQVLLVSNETFCNNGDDTAAVIVALAAQLFSLDSKGKIVPLGEVRSQSTGDPIAMAKDGLMTAGHHYVNVYNVTGKPESLELTECINVEFDKDDSVTSHYENRKTDTYRDSKDKKDIKMMFDRFNAAKPIIFKYVK